MRSCIVHTICSLAVLNEFVARGVTSSSASIPAYCRMASCSAVMRCVLLLLIGLDNSALPQNCWCPDFWSAVSGLGAFWPNVQNDAVDVDVVDASLWLSTLQTSMLVLAGACGLICCGCGWNKFLWGWSNGGFPCCWFDGCEGFKHCSVEEPGVFSVVALVSW